MCRVNSYKANYGNNNNNNSSLIYMLKKIARVQLQSHYKYVYKATATHKKRGKTIKEEKAK
jgi:hypothetical protein